MRHAVVRVNPDPSGGLSLGAVRQLRTALRAAGVGVVESDLTGSLPQRRELELVLADDDLQTVRERALALVREAISEAGLEADPSAGALTFTSAGTPSDALGIFRAFGVRGEVRRALPAAEDDVVFLVRSDAYEHVSESRLLTALQSGLNQQVTLVTEWPGPTEPLDAL